MASKRPVTVHLSLADPAYLAQAEVAGHVLRVDEPLDLGGGDTGPAPDEIVLQALGACTAITLRMYAERKQWPLTSVHVVLGFVERSKERTVISRSVQIAGALDEEQRQRLLQIANACPVHRLLLGQVDVATVLADG